ncbi:MAG: phosphopentomutase [Armatimonadetes bacterium]|nr:phosphopentomutase [Armatimonadota bacterium]
MRAVVLVLDGCGIGALPDAADYGDEGSNTLVNTARAVGGLRLPVLERLGLGVLDAIPGVTPVGDHEAAAGVMRARAAGKDSTTGHWELAGLVVRRPFPTYPEGFPADLIRAFERQIGRETLGNVAASGTEIIETWGPAHLRSGAPIVYTSADSVFQIAAHEAVVPVEQLYEWCRIARGLLVGDHAVSRVIARPFVGTPGAFARTDRRHDFSLPPVGPTVLDALADRGIPVVGVGKIEDLFAGRGLARSVHTHDDADGITQTVAAARGLEHGLVFTNLVELDTVYGHRNNSEGFAQHLQEIDARLPEILGVCAGGDLVVITADHGNDPTTPSTDHSREQVPLLAWRPGLLPGVRLGVRESFADLGATVAEAFAVPWGGSGESFWTVLEEGRG